MCSETRSILVKMGEHFWCLSLFSIECDCRSQAYYAVFDKTDITIKQPCFIFLLLLTVSQAHKQTIHSQMELHDLIVSREHL